MKICLTTRFSPWDIRGGGMAIIVHNFAHYLTKAGHKVVVIYTTEKNKNAKHKIFPNVNYKIEWARHRNITRYIFTVAEKLRQLNEKISFDIIHGNGPETLLFPKIINSVKNRLIISSHYANMWPLHIKNLLKYSPVSIPIRLIHNIEVKFEKYSCHHANKIVVFSKWARKNTMSKYNLSKKNINIIPIGVDPHFLTIDRKNVVKNSILFCGRLVEQKGLDILLYAMSILKKDFYNIKLNIVGEGIEKRKYIKLSKNLKIDSIVNFHGYVPMLQLLKFYSNADLFVLPSRSESLGISLIEAMACGLPIISTSVDAIPEIIKNGETGILVPPENPEALAQAIANLLSSPDLQKRMSQMQRSLAINKYNWKVSTDKLIKIYENIR